MGALKEEASQLLVVAGIFLPVVSPKHLAIPSAGVSHAGRAIPEETGSSAEQAVLQSLTASNNGTVCKESHTLQILG